MKASALKVLLLTTPSFIVNHAIPSMFTCDGENTNPTLEIDNIPEEAECLAIIVEDPDAPNGTFTHWLAWNIPPKNKIERGKLIGGEEGLNDFGKHNYMGPCPPKGEEHRYFFKVFALATVLHLDPEKTRKEDLERAMEDRVVAYGEIMGTYKRL